MKKLYVKPEMAIEEFLPNEYVGNSCTITVACNVTSSVHTTCRSTKFEIEYDDNGNITKKTYKGETDNSGASLSSGTEVNYKNNTFTWKTGFWRLSHSAIYNQTNLINHPNRS